MRIIATLFFAFAFGLTAAAQCGTDSLRQKSAELPIYPPIARTAHITGDVLVAFDIDEEGQTTNVRVTSGPPMLGSSVTDNVKSWRFVGASAHIARKNCQTSFRYSLSSQETEGMPKLEVCFRVRMSLKFTLTHRSQLPCTDRLEEFRSLALYITLAQALQTSARTPASAINARKPAPNTRIT